MDLKTIKKMKKKDLVSLVMEQNKQIQLLKDPVIVYLIKRRDFYLRTNKDASKYTRMLELKGLKMDN